MLYYALFGMQVIVADESTLVVNRSMYDVHAQVCIKLMNHLKLPYVKFVYPKP
jgi:hypothetical protein